MPNLKRIKRRAKVGKSPNLTQKQFQVLVGEVNLAKNLKGNAYRLGRMMEDRMVMQTLSYEKVTGNKISLEHLENLFGAVSVRNTRKYKAEFEKAISLFESIENYRGRLNLMDGKTVRDAVEKVVSKHLLATGECPNKTRVIYYLKGSVTPDIVRILLGGKKGPDKAGFLGENFKGKR